MDSGCEEVLTQWGLTDLIDRFQVNKIDVNALRDLNEKLIAEIIPEIGLRARFLTRWNDLMKKREITSANNKGTSENNDFRGHTSENTDELSSSESEHCPDNVEPIPGTSQARKLTRQEAFVGEEAFRKTQRCGVATLLERSLRGRLIQEYHKKAQVLTPQIRNRLVDVLITEALGENDGNLKNDDLEFLAKDIVKVFPLEVVETYYIAPVKKEFSRNNKSLSSKGKLVDKYRNKRREYRRLIGAKKPSSECAMNSDSDTETGDADAEITESINWLKANQAPWEVVVGHWKKTFKFRKNELNKNSDKTVYAFIEAWPILKNPSGYILIDEDFAASNLTKICLDTEVWKQFFKKVESVCPLKSTCGVVAEEFVSVLERNDLSDDQKVSAQISLLSFHIPPRGRIRTKTVNWKPSMIESKDSLIVHAKIPGDVFKLRQERVEAMRKLKLTDQPYIIVVGETIADIKTFFVCIDSVLYEVPSALKALDICFKTFHVLDAEYSKASEHIWYLLQIGLYDFTTKYDKKISYIMEVVNAMSSVRSS